ncbi:MAG: 4Fe-4S dicluster domain-containing protein [Capsulimonadaceae bacterium]
MKIESTIKYDADRVRGFAREIKNVAGCENLDTCIQCGTCSGTCPLSIYMDYTPRQVMALVRSDFKNEVLSSKTVWLCASCYACTAECPRQIRITDVMYALKQRAIQENAYPKGFPIPILAKEFIDMIRSKGRVTETQLVMRLFLKTNWLAAMGYWRVGLGLMGTGRFALRSEHTERPDQIAAMLKARPRTAAPRAK